MNLKRKMLSILPAFTILLAILLLSPVTAKAATNGGNCGKNGNNVTWSYDDSSKTLTISGTGEMEDYEVEGNISPWRSAGLESDVKSVDIEEGVTSIGDCAFGYCESLTDITIPDDVKSIGWSAFYGCESLTDITIPGGVTNIGDNPFCGCSSLARIEVESSNKVYDSRNNCNAIIDTASKTLISGC